MGSRWLRWLTSKRLMEEDTQRVDQSIMEQVKECLDEIQLLRNDLARVEGDARRVYLLKCEMFRRFGIIDRMVEGVSRASIISDLKNDIVPKAKREAQCEAVDLKRFPICRVVAKREGPVDAMVETFAFTELLPECQEHVLGYLTSPQDKLNAVLAMPYLAPYFYFDLIFPILMDHGYLSGLDLWRLGRVNSHFRDVTLQYMSNCLVESTEHHYFLQIIHREEIDEIVGTMISDQTNGGAPRFCRHNPAPAIFFMEKNMSWDYAQLGGKRIWAQWIDERHDLEPDAPYYMKEVLPQTPNLRALVVNELFEGEEEPNVHLDGTELPDLPLLRHLRFAGKNTTLEALLFRYANTLEHLHILSLGMGLDGSVDTPILLPRLTTCELEASIASPMGYQPSIQSLFRFLSSPLKRIAIVIRAEVGVGFVDDLPFLLELLSSEFGGTLEDLTIWVNGGMNERTGPASSLIASLRFPKMRRFELCGFKGSLAFLLQFPKLEELSLTDVDFPEGDVVDLSWEVEKMHVSSIWKLLPHLEKVSLKRWRQEPGNGNRMEVKTTRLNCIERQNQQKSRYSGCILC